MNGGRSHPTLPLLPAGCRGLPGARSCPQSRVRGSGCVQGWCPCSAGSRRHFNTLANENRPLSRGRDAHIPSAGLGAWSLLPRSRPCPGAAQDGCSQPTSPSPDPWHRLGSSTRSSARLQQPRSAPAARADGVPSASHASRAGAAQAAGKRERGGIRTSRHRLPRPVNSGFVNTRLQEQSRKTPRLQLRAARGAAGARLLQGCARGRMGLAGSGARREPGCSTARVGGGGFVPGSAAWLSTGATHTPLHSRNEKALWAAAMSQGFHGAADLIIPGSALLCAPLGGGETREAGGEKI